MGVAEPNSESSIDGLKVTLRRVIRDESLDALGFEVELVNRSGKDFLYDPESFGVRIGDEVYPEAISDAAGIVEAGKTLPAFFVVAGTATGGRNDLAVTNKFDIVIRQVVEAKDSKSSSEATGVPETVPAALRRFTGASGCRLRRMAHNTSRSAVPRGEQQRKSPSRKEVIAYIGRESQSR